MKMKLNLRFFNMTYKLVPVLSLAFMGVFFSLLFNFLLVQILNLKDFGLYVSINYLFSMVALGASSIQAFVALETIGSDDSRRFIFWKDLRILKTLRTGISLNIAFVILLLLLALFVKGNFFAYTVAAFYIPSTLLLSVVYGRLQASGQITTLNLVSLINNLVKFLSILPFFILQNTVTVLLVGIVVSSYISLAVAIRFIRTIGTPLTLLSVTHSRKLGYFAILFWALSGIDILFSRFALNDSDAGLYGIEATFARLLLMPVVILSVQQFSYFSQIHSGDTSDIFLVFKKLLFKCVAMYFFGAIVFVFLGEIFLDLVLPNNLQINKWDVLSYTFCLIPLIIAIPFYYLICSRVRFTTIVRFSFLISFSAAMVIVYAQNSVELKLILMISGFISLLFLCLESNFQERIRNVDK
jgi:hypothetical protein